MGSSPTAGTNLYRGNGRDHVIMEKKLIAFRCPADLLAEIDATCEKYALDRTAYITLAIRHMEDLVERNLRKNSSAENSRSSQFRATEAAS